MPGDQNDATTPDVAQPPPGEPRPEGVLADLAEAGWLIDRVLATGTWQLSDAGVVEAVRVSAVLTRKVQGAHLTAVAELDDRPGAVAGSPAKHPARAYLQAALLRTKGQAKADVTAARAFKAGADPGQGGLRRLAAAFAAGELSREHVDVAVRAVGVLPKKLLPAIMVGEDGSPILDEDGQPMCAGDVLDEKLTGFAREHDSHAFAQWAKELKDAVDPDGSFDPDQCLRRRVRTWWDHAGMFNIRGELDPAAGALVAAVLDHFGRPRRFEGDDEDGDTIRVSDARSQEQRYADALTDMAKAAASASGSGTRGGEPARVTVITRVEDLAAARAAAQARHRARARHSAFFGSASSADDSDSGHSGGGHSGSGDTHSGCGHHHGDGGTLGTGHHVDPWLMARLACDAVLQRALLAPNGAILNLGREVRTATPAQRRALIARDRGCVVPGCTVPAAWCEAHHVQFWSEGGPSDIGNYALLCTQHHTETHTGVWVLEVRDGTVWIIPPVWLDPERRPRRNLFHHRVQAIRDLGTQLRINLDNGTTRAQPPPDGESKHPPEQAV